MQPLELDAEGKDTAKWRLLSPRELSSGCFILSPETHWHFEIVEDTTIVSDCLNMIHISMVS